MIEWAEALHPDIIAQHCSGSKQRIEYRSEKKPPSPVRKKVSREEAVHNTERFLSGFRADESDLWHASKIYPSEEWCQDSILVLEHLYLPDEFICICTEFELHHRKDGSVKPVPKGAGQTRTVNNWVSRIKDKGTPESAAGAWFRINPVTEAGSGAVGAHTDANVTAWRYLLVESDTLPIELQVSLYAKLVLPVAAIWTSGGKSAHAAIRLDSQNEQQFGLKADFILSRLVRFGVDRSNRNASRYSRLPGALRSVDGQCSLRQDNAGRQRLLYLNPRPGERAIFQ